MGLVAQLARVSTGDPNPDPRDNGEHQELSVRSQLEREGYEQPYGKTDAEIRVNLKIDGKAADVVGYNPKTSRWLVAESKGGDIEGATKQLANTFKHLLRSNPNVSGRVDLRLYTNQAQYSKMLTEDGLAGWRIRDGYLGWIEQETNTWTFWEEQGVRATVFSAP